MKHEYKKWIGDHPKDPKHHSNQLQRSSCTDKLKSNIHSDPSDFESEKQSMKEHFVLLPTKQRTNHLWVCKNTKVFKERFRELMDHQHIVCIR